jgi:hypothetical protein
VRRAKGFLILAVAALLASPTAALAQVLYKWVDKDGRVHFSDKPPAAFKGEVTTIQPDAVPDQVVRPPVAPPKARAEVDEKPKPDDVASKRRQLRERLALRLAQARANVEAARKALEDGEDAVDGERQFVRQNFPRDARRPARTPPPRANCQSTVGSDGKAVWNCPRQIPTESYFDRREKLEEAVKKAEEELVEAERAYRRGVD